MAAAGWVTEAGSVEVVAAHLAPWAGLERAMVAGLVRVTEAGLGRVTEAGWERVADSERATAAGWERVVEVPVLTAAAGGSARSAVVGSATGAGSVRLPEQAWERGSAPEEAATRRWHPAVALRSSAVRQGAEALPGGQGCCWAGVWASVSRAVARRLVKAQPPAVGDSPQQEACRAAVASTKCPAADFALSSRAEVLVEPARWRLRGAEHRPGVGRELTEGRQCRVA